MDLQDLQHEWDTFGRKDPLWAIITDPSRRHNRWDIGEFFRSGETEIEEMLAALAEKGLDVPTGRALDFGCGVGRATQALCARFEQCDGVDIAPSMIALAERYNRYGARCAYHVNGAPDLSLFPDGSFDFVYSVIVLQHVEPRYSKRYIQEFVRVLAPGGMAVFQIPAAQRPFGVVDPRHRRARLTLTSSGAPPAVLGRGEVASVVVRVGNDGTVPWPAAGSTRFPVALGNHWLSVGGQVAVLDDGRAYLDHEVKPGEETELSLSVTAPTAGGKYRLELDMVEEGQAWFAHDGSPTVQIPVRVRSTLAQTLRRRVRQLSGLRRRLVPSRTPVMEMHAVPRSEVEAVVAAAGGRVLDVSDYAVCGPGWESYRYVVTPQAGAAAGPAARPASD